MDREAGGWTTSGNIGLPPLARVEWVDNNNQSDHCSIVLSLNIDVCKTIHSPTVHRSRKQWNRVRKQWNRASESDKSVYRNELDNCLKCIHVPIEPINCNNMLCNESVHINCIPKFHDVIILAAITASDVIPETV